MYAIIDVETTGHGPRGNKITEISIFLYDGEKVVDEFTSLVNPESPIPYKIRQLTGIDDTMVADAPKFYEIAKKVFEMTENAVFVAHNVSFDYGVIRNEYKELGATYERKRLCTVRLSRKLLPNAPRYSLGHLASYLDITIDGRHRARGDAEATVKLFKILQARDGSGSIETALDRKSKEASLPPHLDRADVEALPEKEGVYYFWNEAGKVIYVGKAKNIRQRVMSHFYSKAKKEVRMFETMHRITFEKTGSELLALLLESHEIKHLWPMYNSAQKRQSPSYSLFHYEDQNGVIHLGYAPSKQVSEPSLRFYSVTKVRNHIELLCEEFELCPRYCQLQSSRGACFHYGLKQCKGVCCHKESVSDYNERVKMALSTLPDLQGDLLITEQGREDDEEAFVMIDRGLYLGYGYYPRGERPKDRTEYMRLLIRRKDNQDIHRILHGYLRSTEEAVLYRFEKDGRLQVHG